MRRPPAFNPLLPLPSSQLQPAPVQLLERGSRGVGTRRAPTPRFIQLLIQLHWLLLVGTCAAETHVHARTHSTKVTRAPGARCIANSLLYRGYCTRMGARCSTFPQLLAAPRLRGVARGQRTADTAVHGSAVTESVLKPVNRASTLHCGAVRASPAGGAAARAPAPPARRAPSKAN